MNKWLEILLGLILVIAPVLAAIYYPSWGAATIAFLKGGVICFVVLIGLLFLMLGISDLKE
ncbi:MAG: hypothetical protein ACP5OG_04695 [Candidatus Nanoarchaeia archaeon]